MTPVLLGLLIAMGVAVAIVLGVALPHLRQGSRILSDQGEQTVRQLRERAGSRPPAPADPQPAGARRRRAPAAAGPAAGARLAAAATRARDAFDRTAGRAGRAADRFDLADSGIGVTAEQLGERARQRITDTVRWLGTRPSIEPTAPDAPATATAPTGIPVAGGQPALLLPPEAPRTPEVGIPSDRVDPLPQPLPTPGAQRSAGRAAARPVEPLRPVEPVLDLRDPPQGLTIDLRDLPELPALRHPVAVREDEPSDAVELDPQDDDESVQVGPRHAR